MDFINCEHCGSMFWSITEATFCPLCAIVKKMDEQAAEEPQQESTSRHLEHATA